MSGIVHDVGGYHSHKKLYIWTGLVLAVLTVIELLIPFWEWMGDARNPVLIILAFAKLAGVVGIFMHLKDDKNVFRLVFLAPMLMALAAIVVLGLMAVRHFAPYGGGYVKLAVEKTAVERGVAGGPPRAGAVSGSSRAVGAAPMTVGALDGAGASSGASLQPRR